MKNKEIEVVLNYLKDEKWDYYPTDLIPYKVLLMEERDILLSYIEQLEKDNKDLDKENQILFESNLNLQNNRDKAIEYFKFENPEIFKNPKYTNHLWTIDGLTIKRFIDKLKGDSDE